MGHCVVHLHGVPLLLVAALGHPMMAIISRPCHRARLTPPRVRKMKKSMSTNLVGINTGAALAATPIGNGIVPQATIN